MTTAFENIKGKKPISPNAQAHVKDAHEMASGKSSGPRGAANTPTGRESKATRNSKKK